MSQSSVLNDWTKSIPTTTGRASLASYLTIGGFIAALGFWAATVPLEGAAVAPGVVAAAGKNFEIQHLEGGIIDSILVQEGDRVTAGQELYRLDPTVPNAQLNRMNNSAASLKARVARLQAERDDLKEIAFDSVLLADTSEQTKEIIAEQTSEFQNSVKRHEAELSILDQRLEALEESIKGLAAQKGAAESQLTIVDEEIERKRTLLDKGLTDRSQFTALMRNQAELLGQIGSATAGIASAKSQIVEAKQQLERAGSARVEAASKDLTEARRQLADVNEQIVAAKSVLDRIIVRSPANGIVIKLNANSPGRVVRPGEPLLEMLPTNSNLIIEARLNPTDVDVVTIGQAARLRFVALNQRSTPEVAGEVIFISPDRLIDQATQQPYYSVRLRITDELPAGVKSEQFYPGTPVEAFISTGGRTFVEYLYKPIQDSFSKAFREE
ncbi:MAG: HlyD family type I secretion periplasmic adaptor subunit [Rhizobiaceae bacterium]